jgi:drug/metabolite transporter (DMT)-like permease
MGASLVIHVGYYIALAGAYRHGDLGLTYPIMRGFAPLLVALGSSAVIGEVPSPGAWLGIVGITCGVALVGLSRPGQALHQGKALAYAFANAAIIAAYTFTDGLGVRSEVAHGGATLRYVLMLFVLDGIAYPLGVWLHRGPAGRRTIVAYARSRWPLAALGGTASIGSYAIALWAMTRAPVASVAALRETSVLFAAVLGTCLLKEKFGLQRAIGTLVVVAGVMALRLG